jgi:hypothetical protein
MMTNRKAKPNSSTASGPATFDTVREIARGLPGAVEGISYGTQAFRVGKTLFVRQHQDDDSLVVKIDHDQRAMRMKADPHTFYITDHYLNYPWILVRLATVEPDDLQELLEDAWRLSAPAMAIALLQPQPRCYHEQSARKTARKKVTSSRDTLGAGSQAST